MKKHRENDRIGKEEKAKDERKLKKMKKKAAKILEFLNTHEDRRGASGEMNLPVVSPKLDPQLLVTML